VALQAERKKIIEDEERAGGRKTREEGGGGDRRSAGSDMVAKEAARLEVMKRRQERELQQLVSYEIMRKQMQVLTPPFCIAPIEKSLITSLV
jgi:hypothetical protein